jgi:hypothetical protein
MTEEQFVALAREQYHKLKELKGVESFYEFEKLFDKVWTDFGNKTMERTISVPPKDRRKKKHLRDLGL